MEKKIISINCFDKIIKFDVSENWQINDYIIKHKTFYEKDLLFYLKDRIDTKGSAIDIGANIGNHTLFFKKIIGMPEVYSFEPNPKTYKVLINNLRLNNIKKVFPVNIAVGSNETNGFLINNNKYNIGATMIRKGSGKIKIMPLDLILEVNPPNNKISLIKIDVEGFEFDVLHGCRKTLTDHSPILAIEIKEQKSLEKIDSFLERFNYERKFVGNKGYFNYTPTYIYEKKIMTAREYLNKHWPKVIKNIYSKKNIRRLRECSKWLVGKKFADIGCAFGHSTYILWRLANGNWTGFDIDEDTIKIAQSNFNDIKFMLFEKNIPTEDSSFDCVICSEVIEHIENPAFLIEEVVRISRARSIFTTPKALIPDPTHIHWYNLYDLRNIFKKYKPIIYSDDTYYYIVIEKKVLEFYG